MALPPKGDPRRALMLAIRYSWLMAALMGTVGLTSLGSILLRLRGGQGIGSVAPILTAVSVLYVGPGVTYLIGAIQLKRRARWACSMGIAVAFVQVLFYGGAVLMGVVMVLVNWRITLVDVIMIPGSAMLAAALAVLIVLLNQAYIAIGRMPDDQNRGFEAVLPMPVDPPEKGAE